jgi:hypothetical protein
MSLGLVMTFTTLKLESDHFLGPVLIYDLSGDFGTVDERGTNRYIVAGTGCEDFPKGYSVTNLGVDFLNVDFVTLFHAVLFSAGFEDCVGHRLFP